MSLSHFGIHFLFKNRIIRFVFRVCCLFFFLFVTSDAPAHPHADSIRVGSLKRLFIKKAIDRITIDAHLNEQAWQDAEVATGFIQNFPFDTSLACAQTEVRATYDDATLYISAICYDHSNADFVVQSLRRDFGYEDNDNFSVVIDPLSNQTTGFLFSVSPFGVQSEGLISGGGGFGSSATWDNAWQAEARIDSGKWIAELAIPFNTLRFKSGTGSWRINFVRNNLKVPESSSWAPIPRAFRIANLAFAGELLWESAPENRSANLSFIPYTIGSMNANYQTRTFPNPTANFGGDAKLALSSALNLDLTFNPDFSQVDVDRQITNLDRFTIFFPELRQFFLENSDLFSSLGFSRIRPFFLAKLVSLTVSRHKFWLARGSRAIWMPIGVSAPSRFKQRATIRFGIMGTITPLLYCNACSLSAQA
ncbi:MAG: hypothetical protein CMR00_08720 [[Chlorobium] sp. 445]|nr:MAG: hypothetical protein CMR00_08720 [[Chlorobium] sp. 445]